MIQQITLALINDDGDRIDLPEKGANNNISSKLDISIAEKFTEINRRINDLGDGEMRTAEKFNLALELDKYLSEFRRIYETRETIK